MFEWLKRLVARRELEELDRWRVECVEARRWFAEFPEVAHALDYLAGFAKGVHGGRIDQARERMRNMRAISSPRWTPLDIPEPQLAIPPAADPWMHQFAAEWRAASHEEPGRAVDYRFLGMTGEEDS
ncbi:hypothetical protein [Burkholderia cenocepacia]|uniref:Uncharacterized protein n=1 Tax=Burkholderia cenocepacia TaxID=95486 RepID=A0A1V2W349_9BURK|nr:hypothetical protein [Burkholderia cenocepacia]MBR8248678.1 hypothetical protein [Burkholderia cenocepacia]MBR8288852.1 hypothetical protein [Burkholderia cenocepacia]MBR8497121.1 hypothetical protein [Burkholderia cenocepacia]ONJ13690.1 hypothetical protein A8D83_12030 [Burkholderia cenocepacia]ONJ30206.1 hypothetical protein A8D90_07180 [Burkholderia cenocepacia]